MTRKRVDLLLQNVEIEAVAAEGKALAHVVLPGDEAQGENNAHPNGRVVFVEFAVPGDVVDIRVIKKKKSYMEGRIERLVKPSGSRLEPFCEHFGVCGGCKWQPLPYQMQLDAKRQQVYDQLVRIGHLDVPEIRPTLPSQRTQEYRNKLEYSASCKKWIIDPSKADEENGSALGFHIGKFYDKVLDINKCHLQPEPTNEIRNFIKQYCIDNGFQLYDIRENRGVLRNIIVRSNEKGEIMLTVCFGEDFPGLNAMLDEILDKFHQIKSLYYVVNRKLNDTIADQNLILYKGDDAIYEEMEGLSFKIGPKSFYQTNTLQAYELYKVAREFAGLTGSEVVYDLYTGTGTIAQFVSKKAKKVIGIEYVEDAIKDARVNAANNGIENCEFFAGDMKDVLNVDFIAEHGRPDVIILDPPRAGIHPDVAKVILEAAPERMVYVSCNPASQARDLDIFCNGTDVKYKITAVQPVDMFPHTHHVENVVRLERICQ